MQRIFQITDGSGHYDVRGNWHGSESLTVAVEDIDGDKNGGEFAPDAQEVKIDADDYVEVKDGWYRGMVVLTADFRLVLKDDQVPEALYGVMYTEFEEKPNVDPQTADGEGE